MAYFYFIFLCLSRRSRCSVSVGFSFARLADILPSLLSLLLFIIYRRCCIAWKKQKADAENDKRYRRVVFTSTSTSTFINGRCVSLSRWASGFSQPCFSRRFFFFSLLFARWFLYLSQRVIKCVVLMPDSRRYASSPGWFSDLGQCKTVCIFFYVRRAAICVCINRRVWGERDLRSQSEYSNIHIYIFILICQFGGLSPPPPPPRYNDLDIRETGIGRRRAALTWNETATTINK